MKNHLCKLTLWPLETQYPLLFLAASMDEDGMTLDNGPLGFSMFKKITI